MASSLQKRKAAIVLLSLPEAQAADVLRRLEPALAEQLALQMAETGAVEPLELQAVLGEFTAAAATAPRAMAGGPERARRLFVRAHGVEAAERLTGWKGASAAGPLDFLAEVDASALVALLGEEHPQTVALVLAHLAPAQAADVLAGFPEQRQLTIVRRIAHMGRTSPEMIGEVAEGLRSRLASVLGGRFQPAGGPEVLAGLLNVSQRSLERKWLGALEQEDPELAQQIRGQMFSFEDLARLDPEQVEPLLKSVTLSQWAVALKGVPDAVSASLIEKLSPRAGQLLREELEFLGPVSRAQVATARQQILDLLHRLEDAGEIDLRAASASGALA